MSALLHKRTFDAMCVSPQASPVASFCRPSANAEMSDASPFGKRLKNAMAPAFASPTQPPADDCSDVYFDRDMPVSSSSSAVAQRTPLSASAVSKFVAPPPISDLDSAIIDALPPNARRALKKSASRTAPVLSLDDVRPAIEQVLAQRELELRQEFDAQLNHLLREQFEVFTKFNHDYLHRQLKRGDTSYLG
jgi:hypothetical protein